MTIKFLKNIETQNVTTSYSGKQGCACGCNGSYKYSSAYQELSGAKRGYAIHEDEVSDLAIKRATNFFNKNQIAEVDLCSNGNGKYNDYAFIKTNDRIKTIYFTENYINNLFEKHLIEIIAK
ncbi:hypothetical protein Phi19:2_gp010 [Cellulophaga phage phi19:2]|uniref:Uncharacterized protein n=2 Tax=Cellulophaga phage phiST TaxID=756282 RepID=M4T1V8_9CAUD|nr:hypothetical protein CGPG_00096 [Cellulophaga phage phiST]AGH56794.1 hypothetical protein CGPG_00096 [Cellulophaga phage phiST]AGO47149.1 hypothetical protein PhiST_gp010 [Cellulophaga phage phiST]AGO48645.1 hypothetical protein Phi19:2_gp010 [Cellulophaga phage phi19:2]